MQPTTRAQGDGSPTRERSRSHSPNPLAPRTRTHSAGSPQNVGTSERLISTLLGGAFLLSALRRPSPRAAAYVLGGSALLHRGVTGHCYVYDALGRTTRSPEAGTPRTQRSITIEKPAEELYRAWRDPGHLAAIFGDLLEIEGLADGRSRWRARLPIGKTFEWTTSTVADRPGELIAWRSEPGSPFELEGSVRFRPAPRDWGTEVTLSLGFGAPGSPLAALSTRLPRVSTSLEEHVLRRCKSLCVAGEIPTLAKNASARKPASSRSRSLSHALLTSQQHGAS